MMPGPSFKKFLIGRALLGFLTSRRILTQNFLDSKDLFEDFYFFEGLFTKLFLIQKVSGFRLS